MKDSSEYKPALGFGLLLQGPPKTGKTRMCLSFPNVYIADVDNNLSGAVRSFREEFPDAQFKYDIIPIDDDGATVPEPQRWPRLLKCINVALKDPWVKSIVIDSASTVADILQMFIVSEKSGSGRKDEMTISDWIPFRQLLSRLVTNMRLTQRIFVMTSHEENVKDEVSGRLIVRTNIPSKLADNFGGFFSDCWRTELERVGDKMVYVVRAQPTEFYPAIGNSLGLPETFRFNQERILQTIMAAGLYKTKK